MRTTYINRLTGEESAPGEQHAVEVGVIEGFRGKYWVSRDGEVFRRRVLAGGVRKYDAMTTSGNDAPRVRLNRPGPGKTRPRVNTLVEQVWGDDAARRYKAAVGIKDRTYANDTVWEGFRTALGLEER